MEIKTAIILCAGFGKRLNPLTLEKPKPLLDLFNKTLLEHTLNLVEKLNIKKVKLNTYYLPKKIENFLINKNFKLEIDIINDGEKILDTGGGIFNMIKNLNEEDFLVLNPDTFWDENYLEYIKKMEKLYFNQAIKNILLTVHKNLSFDKNLNGDFNLNINKLSRDNPRQFIYTGCQILNKKIFSNFTNSKFSINDVWNTLIKENNLFGFESKNKFIHVTDIKVYKSLLKNN